MKTNIKTRAWLITSLAALFLAFHPAPTSEFAAPVYGEIDNDARIVGALSDAVLLAMEQRDGGDFSLDFVAAAPETYDHNVGGGAYDNRDVGNADDVVESLEGGDFACGDIVTYLTHIEVGDTSPPDLVQSIEIDYEFEKKGQPGISVVEILNVAINYGPVSGGDGPGGTDAGIMDDGMSMASLLTQSLVDLTLSGTIEVTDLEATEKVVVRIDVLLGCVPGTSPTGTLQAGMTGKRVIAPDSEISAIPGGVQTIPFNNLQNIPAALIATKNRRNLADPDLRLDDCQVGIAGFVGPVHRR